MKFHDAPVLMDFRKESTKNPENNCTYYNRMCLRKLAAERKVPVMTIVAQHEGIDLRNGLARIRLDQTEPPLNERLVRRVTQRRMHPTECVAPTE